MRMQIFTIISILFFTTIANSKTLEEVAKFASKEKAQQLLTTEDSFTNNWSQFDIDSRLQKSNSTKAQLMSFISSQALDWNNNEIELIKSILKTIDNDLQKLKVSLPNLDTLYFVKTTGNEEGGANGYTRSNYIVLKNNVLHTPKQKLKKIIVHEIFHLLTRSNNKFREKMYKIIGFRLMNPIEYPAEIKEARITNPDAPQTDSYIILDKNGDKIKCLMVLFSPRSYSGGLFFEYLSIGFLRLEGSKVKKPVLKNGTPIIYTYQDVSNFFEQVGRNTKYIIHPEEILADNFASLVVGETNLPDQWLLNDIKKALSK